jgi:hypothetical protein
MSCHSTVTEWTTLIRLYLPHLSTPQATVLALWSVGMGLARSCALTAVATFLAVWLRRRKQTVRQQLREFCDEAEAKRGDQRHALCVERCVVPRRAWVLSRWQGTQWALALEATTLGRRFTVVAISVVSRGGAMPYGLRAWIEQGFKLTKRAGWPWQRTRMTEPPRAARLWLAVAIATWWRLSVGGAAEETIPEGTLLDVSAALTCQRWQHRATRLRVVSIFRRGWVLILVALLNQAALPLGAFFPEPWPTHQTMDGSVIVPHAGGPHDVAA